MKPSDFIKKNQQEYTHSSDCHYHSGHDCNCGEKTKTHSSDCHYHSGHDCNCAMSNHVDEDIGDVKTRLAAAIAQRKGRNDDFDSMKDTIASLTAKKKTTKRVCEYSVEKVSPAQKTKIEELNEKLKEIGQKMKDVNNIYIAGKKFNDDVLMTAARQKLSQLAAQLEKTKHALTVTETKKNAPRVRKATGKDGVAEWEVLNSNGVTVKKFSSSRAANEYMHSKYASLGEGVWDDIKPQPGEKLSDVAKDFLPNPKELIGDIKRGVKKVAGIIAHPVKSAGDRYEPKNVSGSKASEQGVAEGAPELLKAEMPLVRHIEKELDKGGWTKDDPEYKKAFNSSLAYYRKFGNAGQVNEQGVAEGSEQINEYRDRLLQYVKSLLPTWPDYVLKDWLVPNKGDFSNLPTDALKNGVMEKVQGAGLTPNSKWQLVPDMKFTMDMFDSMTKQRLIGRAGGSSDLGMGIPKDKERHATQAALAQQQGGVRKEPVLLIKTAKGYELLEGWHRTIQHFVKYPEGYTGPAYVAVSQGQQGVAEGSDSNLSYQGNCTEDDVIEHIFGDVNNFANMVEEHGDEFTVGDLVVKYDPETDVHSFYYKKQGVAEAKPKRSRHHGDDTWPEGHARSRFNADGTRKSDLADIRKWNSRPEVSGIQTRGGYEEDEWPAKKDIDEDNSGVDTIEMDTALFIRCLEWAKEDAPDDIALHKFTENVLARNGILTMDDYESLVPEGAVIEGVGIIHKQVDVTDAPTVEIENYMLELHKMYVGHSQKRDAIVRRTARKFNIDINTASNYYDELIPKEEMNESAPSDAAGGFWSGGAEDIATVLYAIYQGSPISKTEIKQLWDENGPDKWTKRILKPDVDRIISWYNRISREKGKLQEDASAGASCASAVATVVTPLMSKPISRKGNKKSTKVTVGKGVYESALGDLQWSMLDNIPSIEDKFLILEQHYGDNLLTENNDEHAIKYFLGLGAYAVTTPIKNKKYMTVMLMLVDNRAVLMNPVEYLEFARTNGSQYTFKKNNSIIKFPIEEIRIKSIYKAFLMDSKSNYDQFCSALMLKFDIKMPALTDGDISEAAPGQTEELVVGDNVRSRNPNNGTYGMPMIVKDIDGNKIFCGGKNLQTMPYRRGELELLNPHRKITEKKMKPTRTYKVGGSDDPAMKSSLKAAASKESNLSELRETPIDWENLGWDKIQEICDQHGVSRLGGEIVDIIDHKSGYINLEGKRVAAVKLTVYVAYNLEDFGYDEDTIKKMGDEQGTSDAINVTLYRDPVNPKIIKSKY